MDDKQFVGFHENIVLTSISVSAMFSEIVKRREKSVTGTMDSNNSLSLKLSTDNDSGYISQNVESNSLSSVDEINVPVILCSDAVANVYVNEDALLERPEVSNTVQDVSDDAEEYEEFGHLYYMNTDSNIEASFVSQKTTFSGFDTSESALSNISNIIPVATPLVLHSSNPVANELENDPNYVNYNKNCNVTNSDNICDQNYEQIQIHLDNVQNVIEDGYSHTLSLSSALCNLYEKGFDEPNDSLAKSDLKISIHDSDNTMSPCIKSYTELKTKGKFKVCNLSQQCKTSTPTKSPNPMSPELFSDDEVTSSFESHSTSSFRMQKNEQVKDNKNDSLLISRLQESLSGLPPPPSVTIIQMSVDEMLQKIKENKNLLVEDFTAEKERRSSILINCKKEDIDGVEFPSLMEYRYHGLHFNRNKTHEDLEHMCVRYAERYIGAETQSSCTVFGIGVNNSSPSKRKLKFRRLVKSPGKRLSHLARRRITFSKDSLQVACSSNSNSFIGSRTRQIMIDAKKFELTSTRRSPYKKRSPLKLPARSPRKKMGTPSSSAKKRYAMRARMLDPDESCDSISSISTCSSKASSVKKALFKNSPDKGQSTNGLLRLFGADISEPIVSKRRTPRRALFTSPIKVSSYRPGKSPRRCLFSPSKASSSSSSSSCYETMDRKRKRVNSGDEPPLKFSKSTSSTSSISSESNTKRSSGAVGIQILDIVEHRKRKLMWAVSQALRSHNVDLKHPQFKIYASILARVIRCFLPNLFVNGPRPEGSTTENMLRIARQHAFAVTRGKSLDEIVREARNAQMKPVRPSGYVALEKILTESADARNKDNILNGNTADCDASFSKNKRKENVERIRKVIDFDEVGGMLTKR